MYVYLSKLRISLLLLLLLFVYSSPPPNVTVFYLICVLENKKNKNPENLALKTKSTVKSEFSQHFRCKDQRSVFVANKKKIK